jgi:hypothetical protein
LVPGSSTALPGTSSLPPPPSRQVPQSAPYAFGGTTPLPFADPVNVSQTAPKLRPATVETTYHETPPPPSRSAFQSTSYAYGGITPLPCSDPVKISRPASQPRFPAPGTRYSEASPLLPVYEQDVQGRGSASEDSRTTSSTFDMVISIIIWFWIFIIGLYYWMKPAGGV